MKLSTSPYLQTLDTSGEFIFISYSHDDREIMEPIAEQLAMDGYRFWFDDGTEGGETWQETVPEKITECTVFLLLITKNMLHSKNCRDELTYAKTEEKTILPAFLSDINLKKECKAVDFQLGNYNHVNFYEYKEDEKDLLYKKLYNSKDFNACKRSDEEQHEFLKEIGQADDTGGEKSADETKKKNEPKQPTKPVVMNSPVKNTDGGHDDEAYNVSSGKKDSISSDSKKQSENSSAVSVMSEEPEISDDTDFNESKDKIVDNDENAEKKTLRILPKKPAFENKSQLFSKCFRELSSPIINESEYTDKKPSKKFSEKQTIDKRKHEPHFSIEFLKRNLFVTNTTKAKEKRYTIIADTLDCLFIGFNVVFLVIIVIALIGMLSSSPTVTENMLWGEKEVSDRGEFIDSVLYQKIKTGDTEIEISAVPFYTSVDPTCNGVILLGFLDRFGMEYYFYGNCSVKEYKLSVSQFITQFNLTGKNNQETVTPEQVYSNKGTKIPTLMTFHIFLKNGEIQLKSENFKSSVILKNKQKSTNEYFTLRGTATGDCFNELKYISISYSPDGDAKVEKLMFDDSGTPINVSVKYAPNKNRILIKWADEKRLYNGRMETFSKAGEASFQFVNTAPYGFVLIGDHGKTVYSYQAEADPAFFESDTEK